MNEVKIFLVSMKISLYMVSQRGYQYKLEMYNSITQTSARTVKIKCPHLQGVLSHCLPVSPYRAEIPREY